MAGRKPKLKLVKGGKKFTLIRGGKRTTKADIRKARIVSAKNFLRYWARRLKVLESVLLSLGQRRPSKTFVREMKQHRELARKIHDGTISDSELERILRRKKELEQLEGR